MEPLNIPAGSQVLLGAPAKPMPRTTSDSIAEMVSAIPGIEEAHLPQCFVVGVIKAPAQILALVPQSGADLGVIMDAVGRGLSQIMPQGTHLDVWLMQTGDELLADVRGSGCQILARKQEQKSRWKFWS